MKANKALLVCMLVFSAAAYAQSPDEFLGYPLGTKFTNHGNIVQYFQKVATQAPGKVKLVPYGTTYEGRPLMTAIISSAENIANLEEIQKNNLRLTGILRDKPGNPGAPVIVWLSYNVHGNEPSSSEVAMKVLYELISDPQHGADVWLKNTVVIIDPCMNPDGRERYVSWYNRSSGKFPNADPAAREHDEPWPGGRTNHYYFDLNRDWAWQTQKESAARIKLYRSWMPQVHCDYHEQYPQSPYYFAPAAEPMHEAITQWQKDVQVTFGRYNATSFDENGWLYFTKQYFDLFYPSYGDTYPLFNGAIGMTFEQAGHSPAGLALALGNGDTLTLIDRIAHHFATSMNTIKTASANAAALMGAYKKYFDENNAGAGNIYKAYVVREASGGTLSSLIDLLKKNDISFGYASAGKNIRAFSWVSGKEENVSLRTGDLVINTSQPNARLLRVLFEPQSKLSDSATYDITAWSVPYAYGLNAFASKDAVTADSTPIALSRPSLAAGSYGYVLSMTGIADAGFVSVLQKAGFKLHYSETDFMSDEKKFPAGSVIILRKENDAKMPLFTSLVNDYKVQPSAVRSGFVQSGFDFGSDKVHNLPNVNVALLSGNESSANAVGEVWHLFEEELNRPISVLDAADLSPSQLRKYDVLVVPDGNYKMLRSKDAAADLKAWIQQGGKLVAMENAVNQIAGLDWGLKSKKTANENDSAAAYSDVKKYVDRERESVVNNIPGAIYKTRLDNTHPVGFGYPDYYFTLKQNDRVYEFLKEGWNIATIQSQKQVSGFVGSKAGQNVKDGVLIGEIPMGRGSVVFFADDPIFRSFWQNGKMLFWNAVFFTNK